MKTRTTALALALGLCFAAPALAQTARVERGSIAKTVFGSGEVQSVSQPGVYARIDADVVEWYAELGDAVKAGDVLMKLENDTLSAEVAQLEYDIQLTQKDLLYTETFEIYKYRQAKHEDGRPRFNVNTREPIMEKYSDEITIRAPSDGRVMAVYIEAGDDALAKYREHGCVVMLSTDGRMKVEIESENPLGLELDETVIIRGEDFHTTGTVVNLMRYGTQAVIQVSSDEYPMDAPVTVVNLAGEVLDESILEINKPMAVSAYGGTIKGVMWNVKVGNMLKRYDVIARIDWDETPLYYDNDKVLREHAKKKTELEKAMEKQEMLTVVAPCDGLVASIDVEKGSSVTAGTKVMSIVENGAGMEVILRVDELDIPWVKKGQQVTLAVDALPGLALGGRVVRIAPLGDTETSVTKYDVYVELEGEVDARVKGGMNVTGEIAVSSETDALLVPGEALAQADGGWYVQLQSGERRQVVLGVMTDSQAQIISGLSEGDIVVY